MSWQQHAIECNGIMDGWVAWLAADMGLHPDGYQPSVEAWDLLEGDNDPAGNSAFTDPIVQDARSLNDLIDERKGVKSAADQVGTVLTSQCAGWAKASMGSWPPTASFAGGPQYNITVSKNFQAQYPAHPTVADTLLESLRIGAGDQQTAEFNAADHNITISSLISEAFVESRLCWAEGNKALAQNAPLYWKQAARTRHLL
jgi:hypothetical protein